MAVRVEGASLQDEFVSAAVDCVDQVCAARDQSQPALQVDAIVQVVVC